MTYLTVTHVSDTPADAVRADWTGLAGKPTVDPAYLNGASYLKTIGFTNQVTCRLGNVLQIRLPGLHPAVTSPSSYTAPIACATVNCT